MKKALLVLNSILLSIGTSGGPLVMRLYFIHGGKRVWLSAFLETAGFPLMLPPLAAAYIYRRRQSKKTSSAAVISMKPRLFLAAAVIGTLTGVDDYLYAYGVARLPISTSALIIASQLAFTAVFAFLLVRQKFTAYSINAVVLLTAAAGVLAMHASGDRPAGESFKQYVVGFVMTLGAAALYGFVLPLTELVYKKTKQITYSLVMEFQFVMCFFASLVCCIGMIIDNDFKVFLFLSLLCSLSFLSFFQCSASALFLFFFQCSVLSLFHFH